MRLYSTALLIASAAVTMAACGPAIDDPGYNARLSSTSGGADDSPDDTSKGGGKGEISHGPLPEFGFFIEQVLPALQAGGEMACTSCHTTGVGKAPKFLAGETPRDVYLNFRNYRDSAFVQPPAENLLLNKGAHEGPDLNAEQVAVIKKWAQYENPHDY